MAALALLACLAAAPGAASAGGGRYTVSGGTPDEQAQVRAALDASSFPWSVVPGTVSITIGNGVPTAAWPGGISLDAGLLDTGTFAWAVVQHEYAHQVDFLLLDDDARAALLPLLGGRAWCGPDVDAAVVGLAHAAYGCERFASTLAWAFWPSADNALKPVSARSESAALPPALFRRLLGALLRADGEDAATVLRPFVQLRRPAGRTGAAALPAAPPPAQPARPS